MSDQAGVVSGLVATATGADLDIQATGFLPRATRLLPQPEQLVTLWPVATDLEADAIHQMVYGGVDGAVLSPVSFSQGYLYILLDEGPDVLKTWQVAAAEFGAEFGLAYGFITTFSYDDPFPAILVGRPGPYTGWCTPSPVLGFCATAQPHTFVVSPDRATDPVTIRRVLASQFLELDPLPGLLNPEVPGDVLSPLESQAIRMILQRPQKTRWPDDDRP